jgi:Ni,Fe-hydrogenase III component G
MEELESKFPFLQGKIRVKGERRIFADPVGQPQFLQAFEYAVKSLGFDTLCAITGLEENGAIVAIYHLAGEGGVVLNLKLQVPADAPAIKTVTGIFANAELYEREMADLLGVEMEGLPPGRRYPLPDDWPQGNYPLRKDWTADRLKDGGAEGHAAGPGPARE